MMASEWLATRIADRIGIAVAPCCAIQTLDQRLVFGSQAVATLADRVETARYLTTPTIDELGKGESFPGSFISMVMAFDLFVNNGDRHLAQFVSTPSATGRHLYAIDFGRSLFWDWPLIGLPTGESQTIVVGRQLRRLHRFDLNAAQSIIEGIRSLPGNVVEQMTSDMPQDWLPQRLVDEFLSFWRRGGRDRRCTQVAAELNNAANF